MAAAPLVLAGASTVAGMAGAQAEASGKQAAANYNAQIKQQQATQVLSQAQEDERRQRVQGKMALGGIRNAVGASGIQMDGSALDVLQSSAANSELDALSIRHQGQLKAWAYKAGANLDVFQGEQAKKAGDLASANMLLTGAGKIYDKL